jgi:hypothetical protein
MPLKSKTQAVLPTFAEEWMAQWRSAARELEKVRVRELRELTDQQALERSICLVPVKPYPSRPSSGLVELQQWLQKLHCAQNE